MWFEWPHLACEPSSSSARAEPKSRTHSRDTPDVRVVEVAGAETNQVDAVMDRVVAQALALATAGDTVLLAPAAASMDMFRDYGHRGDVFSAAVRRLQVATR
jgi:UDP-N-acetylmuramoylalanine-D-glutamate ligase